MLWPLQLVVVVVLFWRRWNWWWWFRLLFDDRDSESTEEEETLAGFDRESSKPPPVDISEEGLALAAAIEEEFLESRARFQNPKSISSSAAAPLLLLHVDEGLLFGGLICKDKSGWAGNSSISFWTPTTTNNNNKITIGLPPFKAFFSLIFVSSSIYDL